MTALTADTLVLATAVAEGIGLFNFGFTFFLRYCLFGLLKNNLKIRILQNKTVLTTIIKSDHFLLLCYFLDKMCKKFNSLITEAVISEEEKIFCFMKTTFLRHKKTDYVRHQ